MKTANVVFLILLAAVGETILTPPALSQLQPMSTQQLTDQSSVVLVGTCVQTESYWGEGNSKIFTRVKVRGQQYLKGELGAEAEITVPGGRIGDIVYEVSDMPIFRQGEEVVLFVWTHPTGKQLVIGGAQGKFTVETDKSTGRKVAKGVQLQTDLTAERRGTTPQPVKAAKKVFLDDLLNEVRGHLKK